MKLLHSMRGSCWRAVPFNPASTHTHTHACKPPQNSTSPPSPTPKKAWNKYIHSFIHSSNRCGLSTLWEEVEKGACCCNLCTSAALEHSANFCSRAVLLRGKTAEMKSSVLPCFPPSLLPPPPPFCHHLPILLSFPKTTRNGGLEAVYLFFCQKEGVSERKRESKADRKRKRERGWLIILD